MVRADRELTRDLARNREHLAPFVERQVGLASALAVLLMLLVLAIVIPLQWLSRENPR